MSLYWCNVCSTRLTENDVTTDRRGRTACPNCNTTVNPQESAGHG